MYFVIVSGRIPQKELNPSVIALKCGLNRAKVIFCLQELRIFIERNLSEKKKVHVPVYGIGTLKVYDDQWFMDFDREYLEKISIHDALFVVEDTGKMSLYS